MDYAKNKQYFKKSTKTLIVGILFIVLGLGLVRTLPSLIPSLRYYGTNVRFLVRMLPPSLIGIILLIIGGLIIYNFIKKSISDEEYDNSIKSALSKVENDALENLDIDKAEIQEVEPITFKCFNYDTFDNIKKGKDGKIRTDRYKAVIIYPTQNELNTYEYDFSTTEELKMKTGTTYFYKDIVSISVSTKTRSISNMQNKKINLVLNKIANKFADKFVEDIIITYEDLRIITKGGSSLNVSLIGQNDSIKALRTLLKEKKRT